MYEVGTGKADITAFKEGIGMMGYGMSFNIVKDRGTGLNARAFVFKHIESGKKVVFVNAEMAFIAISIKRGVIKRLNRLYPELNYSLENVFLSAQHTHSGPGGFSHYGFYNFSIPGFVPQVYQKMVEGIVDAIVLAEKSLRPAKLYANKGTFDPSDEVAFNRSIKAYNQNPEVKEKATEGTKHLALDREMKLLSIEDDSGKPIGSINWFGVHCTSLSNDNTSINFDNKGYAAKFLEDDIRRSLGNENFIAAFAQDTAGDVSPNFVWDKKKKWTRGKFEDDDQSAQFNGDLQYKKAKEILQKDSGKTEITGDIDHALIYANFANIIPGPEFTNGDPEAKTGPACLGVGFLKGTKEGPGAGSVGAFLGKIVADGVKYYELFISLFKSKHERQRIREKYRIQRPKHILVETGDRKILGTHDLKNLLLPGWAEPSIKTLKMHHRSGGLDHKPWTPQTLPLHIVTIGQLALVGIPGEITTIAGKRLRKTVLEVLRKKGIEEVLLTTYSNGYCGYITTFEEYQVQAYEGGHTPYGQWTLAAFQTKFKELAEEMLKQPEQRNINQEIQPVIFTEEELSKRSHVEPAA